MNEEAGYRDMITELLGKIESEKTLRRILNFVSAFYCRGS